MVANNGATRQPRTHRLQRSSKGNIANTRHHGFEKSRTNKSSKGKMVPWWRWQHRRQIDVEGGPPLGKWCKIGVVGFDSCREMAI
uniref:Uncharacterized protein n=1 Tax=Oryza sativa subsp. japonica TaxID=39947 RepID=Q8H2U8_ORYSJ|nr:hypothetical protein [Oryza sativa Japonica Group]